MDNRQPPNYEHATVVLEQRKQIDSLLELILCPAKKILNSA